MSKELIQREEMIIMKVTGLTIDPFTNMPIIILKDATETTALPIWIGLIEASSIATELEHIELTRPMTHDLMRNILNELDVFVEKVEINDLADNTFFAKIFLQKGDKAINLDCRPSDALALALRAKAPIFVNKKVIEKSRALDVKQDLTQESGQKWAEILENLSAEDFGKYKM